MTIFTIIIIRITKIRCNRSMLTKYVTVGTEAMKEVLFNSVLIPYTYIY